MADICIHTTRAREREQPQLCSLCVQASGRRVHVQRVQGRVEITGMALRKLATMRGRVSEGELE